LDLARDRYSKEEALEKAAKENTCAIAYGVEQMKKVMELLTNS